MAGTLTGEQRDPSRDGDGPDPMNDLTIALFYIGDEADRWSLLDLGRGDGVIDPDDLTPASFGDAQGGISLYLDRIQCFLDSHAAGDLLSYVHFLLGSLAALSERAAGPALERLRPESDFMGLFDVVGALYHLDGSILVLQKQSGSLRLSYLDPRREAPERRLSPYFRAYPLARNAWIQASLDALDEYFQIVERILQDSEESDDDPLGLADLADLWTGVRPALDQS